MLRRIEPSPADKALRLETVQRDGFVVVGQCLGGILKEQSARSPVQIRRRVLGLFPDVLVEVFHSLVELLRKEIRHATAIVKANVTRSQVYRGLEVSQCLVVISETAFGNGLVMVSGREYRIQTHGSIEIATRSTQVAQIVFGNASVKESPVISTVNAGQYVETAYGV